MIFDENSISSSASDETNLQRTFVRLNEKNVACLCQSKTLLKQTRTKKFVCQYDGCSKRHYQNISFSDEKHLPGIGADVIELLLVQMNKLDINDFIPVKKKSQK